MIKPVMRQLARTPLSTGNWIAYQVIGAVVFLWIGALLVEGACWDWTRFAF